MQRDNDRVSAFGEQSEKLSDEELTWRRRGVDGFNWIDKNRVDRLEVTLEGDEIVLFQDAGEEAWMQSDTVVEVRR